MAMPIAANIPALPGLPKTCEIESSRTRTLFCELIIAQLHKKRKIFYSRIIVNFLTITKNDRENTAVISYRHPAFLYDHVMSLQKMLNLSTHIGNCGVDHRSARVRTASILTARDGRPCRSRTNKRAIGETKCCNIPNVLDARACGTCREQ